MQCFICVTYLLIWSGSGPSWATPAQRSLFRDVLQSLYEHAHALAPRIPADPDNHLPTTDTQPPHPEQLTPRRNDRLEEPPLTYRFPKTLTLNDTDALISNKEEIIVYIDTTKEPKATTPKPKRPKRPKPVSNKLKQSDAEEDVGEEKPEPSLTNTMAGASQIGNRESQMVIKPTVIVNVRGTVSHRDSDIRLESRKNEANNDTKPDTPLNNVFNINQEIKLERTAGDEGNRGPNKVLQDIKIISENVKPRVEEDMMMCETASSEKEVRQERKYDRVLQIMFNI